MRYFKITVMVQHKAALGDQINIGRSADVFDQIAGRKHRCRLQISCQPKGGLPAVPDLGARPGQTFWRIVLPLSLPGAIIGAIFVFVLAVGEFITPQVNAIATLGLGLSLGLVFFAMWRMERGNTASTTRNPRNSLHQPAPAHH